MHISIIQTLIFACSKEIRALLQLAFHLVLSLQLNLFRPSQHLSFMLTMTLLQFTMVILIQTATNKTQLLLVLRGLHPLL